MYHDEEQHVFEKLNTISPDFSRPANAVQLWLDAVKWQSEIEYFDDYTHVISGENNFDDYNYVAWGEWEGGTELGIRSYPSEWVVVDLLDKNQIPQQGTASYSGQLKGSLWSNTVQSANGSISLNANFGTKNITGNMTVNNANTNTAVATAGFNTNMATTDSFGGGLKFSGL